MGQYWIVVNLNKKEYVDPYKLGTGLKLWEQLANHPGTGAALIILLAAMPEVRGGGDLALDEEDPEPVVEALNKEAGVSYSQIAKRTIGRWAGDRIALVGDYAERTDLPEQFDADLIYDLCRSVEEVRNHAEGMKEVKNKKRLLAATLYRDISDDVCRVIEHELRGKFIGEGWKLWEELK